MPHRKHTHTKTVLILYSSRFGQSRKIAATVADELSDCGLNCQIMELTDTTIVDHHRHLAIGLIISVRYGHFAKAAYRLVKTHKAWLANIPSLLMTVSLTARKPEKRDPQRHTYTRKFLKKTGWTPSHTEVVAGALQYPLYNTFDRLCIRLIMLMMKGEADGKSELEYTDWNQVRSGAWAFAAKVRAMVC